MSLPVSAHVQSSERNFWVVAAAIVVIVLGANTPLPLLALYQSRLGFSTAMLSVVYGIYTVGVIAAVFVMGPASDLVGRKRVLLPALITMGLGLLLGMVAANLWMLLASRLLQGLAIGAGTTTAIAALGEVQNDPGNHARVSLTATVATVLGLASGPLVAGALAQFAPFPTVTPYIAALVLVVPVTLAVVMIPEPVAHLAPFQLRPLSIAVPKESAQAFYLAVFVELTAYAVAGTFAGLGSSFAHDLLALQSRFAAGLVVALLFVCSAIAQLAVRQWALKKAIRSGLVTLIIGLALFAYAVEARSAVAFFASAAVLGAGHGLSYLGSQELTDHVAPPDRRAQVFSAFQLGLYAGATIPALIVGFATARVGFKPATLAFAVAIAGFAAVGWLWTTLNRYPAVQT